MSIYNYHLKEHEGYFVFRGHSPSVISRIHSFHPQESSQESSIPEIANRTLYSRATVTEMQPKEYKVNPRGRVAWRQTVGAEFSPSLHFCFTDRKRNLMQ